MTSSYRDMFVALWKHVNIVILGVFLNVWYAIIAVIPQGPFSQIRAHIMDNSIIIVLEYPSKYKG